MRFSRRSLPLLSGILLLFTLLITSCGRYFHEFRPRDGVKLISQSEPRETSGYLKQVDYVFEVCLVEIDKDNVVTSEPLPSGIAFMIKELHGADPRPKRIVTTPGGCLRLAQSIEYHHLSAVAEDVGFEWELQALDPFKGRSVIKYAVNPWTREFRDLTYVNASPKKFVRMGSSVRSFLRGGHKDSSLPVDLKTPLLVEMLHVNWDQISRAFQSQTQTISAQFRGPLVMELFFLRKLKGEWQKLQLDRGEFDFVYQLQDPQAEIALTERRMTTVQVDSGRLELRDFEAELYQKPQGERVVLWFEIKNKSNFLKPFRGRVTLTLRDFVRGGHFSVHCTEENPLTFDPKQLSSLVVSPAPIQKQLLKAQTSQRGDLGYRPILTGWHKIQHQMTPEGSVAFDYALPRVCIQDNLGLSAPIDHLFEVLVRKTQNSEVVFQKSQKTDANGCFDLSSDLLQVIVSRDQPTQSFEFEIRSLLHHPYEKIPKVITIVFSPLGDSVQEVRDLSLVTLMNQVSKIDKKFFPQVVFDSPEISNKHISFMRDRWFQLYQKTHLTLDVIPQWSWWNPDLRKFEDQDYQEDYMWQVKVSFFTLPYGTKKQSQVSGFINSHEINSLVAKNDVSGRVYFSIPTQIISPLKKLPLIKKGLLCYVELEQKETKQKTSLKFYISQLASHVPQIVRVKGVHTVPEVRSSSDQVLLASSDQTSLMTEPWRKNESFLETLKHFKNPPLVIETEKGAFQEGTLRENHFFDNEWILLMNDVWVGLERRANPQPQQNRRSLKATENDIQMTFCHLTNDMKKCLRNPDDYLVVYALILREELPQHEKKYGEGLRDLPINSVRLAMDELMLMGRSYAESEKGLSRSSQQKIDYRGLSDGFSFNAGLQVLSSGISESRQELNFGKTESGQTEYKMSMSRKTRMEARMTAGFAVEQYQVKLENVSRRYVYWVQVHPDGQKNKTVNSYVILSPKQDQEVTYENHYVVYDESGQLEDPEVQFLSEPQVFQGLFAFKRFAQFLELKYLHEGYPNDSFVKFSFTKQKNLKHFMLSRESQLFKGYEGIGIPGAIEYRKLLY